MNTISRTLAALLFGAAFISGAQAQAWPAKPIRFVVPYPPGGSNDVLTRITAQAMAPASASRSSSTTAAARAA